uniref:Uncharacterized protein n=1 Tax=Fagus sylvatica TaxID=28930 RepID=A0A2N9H1T0_FAGSY
MNCLFTASGASKIISYPDGRGRYDLLHLLWTTCRVSEISDTPIMMEVCVYTHFEVNFGCGYLNHFPLQFKKRATAALAGVETSMEISDNIIAETAQDVAVDTSNNVARGTADKIAAGFANVTSRYDSLEHLFSVSPTGIEEIEDEDAEIDAAETVSDAETVAAEVNSADERTASEASFDDVPLASASNPRSVERIVDEHTTVGVVTSAVRAVETTPITITSSGGTTQGNPSGSGSHADPLLFDSSPSTRHYVRRTRRGSIVFTDSERTISATVRVPTPLSPLHESGGTAPTLVVIAAVVSVATTVQEDETVPAAAEETPGSEEVLVHISDIPKGNIVGDTPVDENLVVGTDFGTSVTQIGCAEAAVSKNPIMADVLPGSDIPVVEETFAQDPADNISMEDMVDTNDSYNAILAETGDHVAGTQAADLEVAALITAHTSPTKTIGSGNEAVVAEERRHQIVAVESAARGQPGLLSATSERIVAGVTAAAVYDVVAEAATDVVAKVVDEVIAETVENASNMHKIPAVNDVIAVGMIPKQDSQHKRVIAEVLDDILMYEYKYRYVTDVADFEEIAPKMGTVIRKAMILPLSLGSAFSTPQWSRQKCEGCFCDGATWRAEGDHDMDLNPKGGQAMHVSCDFGFHKLITVPPSRPNDSSSMATKILGLTPLHQTTLLKSDQHKESSFLTGLGRGSYSLSPFRTGMGMVMGFLSHFSIFHASWLLPVVFELLCRSLLREQYQNSWFPVECRAGISWRCLE